ncbi:Ig-like domain-containing protein [Nocardioides sp.]|uniref:Ig-like domain-containing protein n=1 Tax=Nocardioides sp. TaxID=35761 RepID=UPI0027328355|nr:Ig-like domain-containing protein [Nocardioides sp.]MDP3889656.1 Ig-like domain-containing protein [Nocardioides sp.]
MDTQPVYPVTGGGQLELSVLPDWRDPEFGDRVTLDDALEQKGLVTTITPEGLLRVQVPREGAPNHVDYQVSTGGPPSTGTVALNVLRPGSLKPVSPQAQPDVAAGQVGAPIKVRPLDNDIPGADPTDPQARLEIAGQVQPRQGLLVRTDLESGEVTVTARQPGTYSLTYAAGFGVAKRSQGEIRVVVDPASDEADEPIATPDVTTVRGMAPVIVDVLANDYDPRGRLLAVTSARPINHDSALEVAVLDGRWLRISSTTTELRPNPQAVSYELSNGAGRATGAVSVTQKPPLPSEKNSPIPGDDEVTVRVGDSAIVPVLANDTTPSGDPLGLVVPSTTEVVGELSVEPAVGHAYVVGNKVRYVAPASVDGPQTIEVQYVVENTADRTASPAAGTLRVRLNPAPGDTNPNSAPTPRSIEARVVAGDTIYLRLPLVGNDPDGDTVSIVGVSKAPVYGRLLSLGATSLAYQSFPGTPGFDEFSYVVTDRFGAQAEGDIRVVVTNAGSPQAPVAVADVVTADLKRKVELDVLANDLRSPGTRVTILGLENAPEGVGHEAETDLVTLTSSDDSHRPLSFSYRITNGLDDSVGSVTVKSVKGFNNPPVVRDAFAKPEGDSATVTVDVLKTAFDIDGEGAPLTVDPIEVDGVEVDGGKVTLPVLDLPQTVPFRVVDGRGAASAAVIHVPARPTDFPYLRPDASIQVGVGKSVEVPLDDLVVDPEGDPVVITTVDQIVAGPPQMLTASAPKKNPVLQVTAGNLAGPGVVTFQVSDRAKLSDPDAHVATVSVPVQIGDGEPILTCPGDPLPVIEGGPERTYDVASLCHVWTPSPADAAALTFSSEWAAGQQPTDVTLSPDERGFKLKAGVASRGQVGTINIGTAGSDATGELHVKVFEAGPPSLSPISLETEAEESVSVDVAAYASSPFGVDAKYKIIEVVPVTAAAPTPEQNGDTVLTFTPTEFGTFVYQATVADDGGAAGSQRPTATAQITLSVVSAPEAPTGVTWDGNKQDGAVQLSWSAPNANGGAISSYTVYYTGPTNGTQECPAPRCTITNLKNGDSYSFQVTAHNAYGESEKSKAAKGVADRVPGAVIGVAVTLQRDHEVTLEWSPPVDADEYSDIKNYYVSWKGGGTPVKLSGGQLTYKAKLGANGQNTIFNVWAENKAGMSTLKSPAEGMGAGKPETPVMNAPATTDRAGNTAKAVTISWGGVDANGPGPVEYKVTRTGGSGSELVCDWTPNTSCADDLANNGTSYQYKVQARNAEAVAPREPNAQLHISSQSQPVSVEAAATPDEASISEFVATGEDGKAKVTFNVGASHGKTNTIQCNPNCGNLGSTTISNSGQSGLTATINGYSNGQNATFEVRTCNGSSESAQTGPACSAWVNASTTTYGPIPNPSISASGSGQCISWSFSGNANGKAVNYVISMNGSTIRSGQSGVGAYSGNGTECVGHSQTRSFRVDVTDTALAPGQGSARASRSDGPKNASTDPPPVGLSLGKGASAQGRPGCNTSACRYLTATTSNFPAGVTCNIIGATGPGGTAGFIPWNQGANETKQSPNYYGFNGATLTVRCSGGGQTKDAQIVW